MVQWRLALRLLVLSSFFLLGYSYAANPSFDSFSQPYFRTNGYVLSTRVSTNTVYASGIGIPIDGTPAGGGTDGTAVMQALLDRVTNGLPLHIILDGIVAITNSLILHSNTVLEGLTPSCGVVAKTNSNHTPITCDLSTNFVSHDIGLVNLTIYGNSGSGIGVQSKPNQQRIGINQREYVQSIGTNCGFACGLWFAGASNCWARNISIVDALGYSIILNNVAYLDFEGVNITHGEDAFHCLSSQHSRYTRFTLRGSHDDGCVLVSDEFSLTNSYFGGYQIFTNNLFEDWLFIAESGINQNLGQMGAAFQGSPSPSVRWDNNIFRGFRGTIGGFGFDNGFIIRGGNNRFENFDLVFATADILPVFVRGGAVSSEIYNNINLEFLSSQAGAQSSAAIWISSQGGGVTTNLYINNVSVKFLPADTGTIVLDRNTADNTDFTRLNSLTKINGSPTALFSDSDGGYAGKLLADNCYPNGGNLTGGNYFTNGMYGSSVGFSTRTNLVGGLRYQNLSGSSLDVRLIGNLTAVNSGIELRAEGYDTNSFTSTVAQKGNLSLLVPPMAFYCVTQTAGTASPLGGVVKNTGTP